MEIKEILKNKYDFYLNKEKYYPLNLFLHAADDDSKTEEPTETKKRKAREEEGQVFITQELPQSVILIAVVFFMFLFSSFYFKSFMEYLYSNLYNRDLLLIDIDSLPSILRKNVLVFIKLFLPVGALAFFLIVFFTMIQTRFFITTKTLKFNLNKILPTWKNFVEKTIFSRSQIINGVKIILKMLISIILVAGFILIYFEDFIYLIYNDIFFSFKKISLYVYEISIYFGFFLLILAYPDWLVQRSEFIRKLRMTVEEIKQEYKELEGDPQIKKRQRERSREIANKEVLGKVETADVVITNPTHFACAIEYNYLLMDAPKLIAKGTDALAFRIKKIAKENDVPLVENKPLARSLYEQVGINEYIPQEFFLALTKIFSQLDKFKKEVLNNGE